MRLPLQVICVLQIGTKNVVLFLLRSGVNEGKSNLGGLQARDGIEDPKKKNDLVDDRIRAGFAMFCQK